MPLENTGLMLGALSGPHPEPLTVAELIRLVGTLAAAFIALGVMGKFIFKRLGECCPVCSHKLLRGQQINKSRVQEMLKFFRELEGEKNKDPSSLFVCEHCHRVFDHVADSTKARPVQAMLEELDVSKCRACGAQALMYLADIIRTNAIADFRKKDETLVPVLPCLWCTQKPLNVVDCKACPTPLTALGCRKCHTLHAWLPLYDHKLMYLVQLTQKTLQYVPPSFRTGGDSSRESTKDKYGSGWLGRS